MLSLINLPSYVVDREMELIFTPVKLGESGICISYPSCQQDFNIIRFLTYRKKLKKILGQYYHRFTFIMIYLDSHDTVKTFEKKFLLIGKRYANNITSSDSLNQVCQKIINKGLDPYLFLFNARSAKPSVFNLIALKIHELILSTNRFGAQIFYEGDIFEMKFINSLSPNNKFLRNLYFLPVYSLNTTKFYLKSLAKEWKIQITNKKINEITDYCFGYLWVLRELIRLIKANPQKKISDLVEYPSIKFRIETIVNLLTDQEKNILIDLLNQKPNEKIEKNYHYLFQTGIIVKNNNHYVLPLKLMEQVLTKVKIINRLCLDVQENIVYNNKIINHNFSINELRVIKLLLQKKGQLVSRDDIAKVIWQNDYFDHYSEWAIDKLLSRIRNHLIKLNLPKDIIRTKKGQGFILI